jgi:hypothetical protein
MHFESFNYRCNIRCTDLYLRPKYNALHGQVFVWYTVLEYSSWVTCCSFANQILSPARKGFLTL